MLPPTSFKKNASVDSSIADANVVSSKDNANGTRQEVVFRLLCSNDTAGSVIGRKGSIVRALENETGADIRFAAPKTSSGERVVTISAFEVSHNTSSCSFVVFIFLLLISEFLALYLE